MIFSNPLSFVFFMVLGNHYSTGLRYIPETYGYGQSPMHACQMSMYNRGFSKPPFEQYVENEIFSNFTDWALLDKKALQNVTISGSQSPINISNKLFKTDINFASNITVTGVWGSDKYGSSIPCVNIDFENGILNISTNYNVAVSGNYSSIGSILGKHNFNSSGGWSLNTRVYCVLTKHFDYNLTNVQISEHEPKDSFLCENDDFRTGNWYQDQYTGLKGLKIENFFNKSFDDIPYVFTQLVEESVRMQLYTSLDSNLFSKTFKEIQMEQLLNKFLVQITSNHSVLEL